MHINNAQLSLILIQVNFTYNSTFLGHLQYQIQLAMQFDWSLRGTLMMLDLPKVSQMNILWKHNKKIKNLQ